jgi:glycosyltransferase involved in cell wall biosynthesis
MPLFSIIIPVYKVEQYIHECVNSVLNQNFVDFEMIIIDDGSPDNCPAICDEFAATDVRIKVIHKENGGLSEARNVGVKAAIGKFLLFLDSDDYWNDVDFLDYISKLIEKDQTFDIINFGFVKYFPLSNLYILDKRNFSLVKNSKDSIKDYCKKLLQNDLYIASACNKCISRDFILKNQLFFEKGLRSEDMDWCGNILFHVPQMTCIDKQPYVYRQQRIDSITNTVNQSHLYDIVKMINTALTKATCLNSEDKFNYLSFFAVQYLTLLFNLMELNIEDAPQLSKEVYELRSILKYDLNPKVKISNRFMKIFGYKTMAKVLRIYVLKKKR